MSEEAPNFEIEFDGGMTAPVQFVYNGHRVEIVPPDSEHVIGYFWQIKIDGVFPVSNWSERLWRTSMLTILNPLFPSWKKGCV
jgi:hypothetical protein